MQAGGYREKRAGVYEFRVRLVDPLTGAAVRKSHTWRGTKRDVGKALANWIADETKKTQIDPDAQTLSWLIERWIDMQESTLSPDTIRTYRGYKETWIDPSLGRLPFPEVTAGHLRELHAAMASACKRRTCPHNAKRHTERDGCLDCDCTEFRAGGRSASTVHQVHTIIRGALTYAMERFGLTQNVAAIRKAPKLPPSEVVACTDEELAALLIEAGDPGCDLWASIALGAALGRRLGQLCTIQYSGIDFDARTVSLRPTRKSPKVTTLPIDELTADVLKTRMDWQRQRWERVYGGPHPRELVPDPHILSFVSDGTEPNPDSYTGAFSRLRTQLGYPHLHFHCLRHWCATTLINLGTPLPVVAERLGHSSPAVTARIYAHVVAGRQDEAAAALGRALPLKAVSLAPLIEIGE